VPWITWSSIIAGLRNLEGGGRLLEGQEGVDQLFILDTQVTELLPLFVVCRVARYDRFHIVEKNGVAGRVA
jgi:hypothetical protein